MPTITTCPLPAILNTNNNTTHAPPPPPLPPPYLHISRTNIRLTTSRRLPSLHTNVSATNHSTSTPTIQPFDHINHNIVIVKSIVIIIIMCAVVNHCTWSTSQKGSAKPIPTLASFPNMTK